MMTPTRVEMKQTPPQIMETSISKPWVTYWYSDRAQLTSQIFKPRSHREVENVVSKSLPASKTGSKLSSPLVRFVKNISFQI